MDFTTLLSSLQDVPVVFSSWDIGLAVTLSFLLSMVIGWIYMNTYQGVAVAYTKSYVYTLTLMSMVVAVIMLIIGSSIARAFALVGALSIVRFRNALKDTRDIGFIFFAMAVGMAAGTRLYILAIFGTISIGFLWWLITKLDPFARNVKEQILKIRLPVDVGYDSRLFESTFAKYLHRFDLISVETVQAGTLTELMYDIKLKQRAKAGELLDEVRKLNHNNKVVLITGYHSVDL
jgi:hypothetical protein